MLAESAPSSRAASWISHCAAATTGPSEANAAVQARSRITSARNASGSSTISRSPSRWAAPPRRSTRSGTLVATWGIGWWSPLDLVDGSHGSPGGENQMGADLPVSSELWLHHHQEDDHQQPDRHRHPAPLDPLNEPWEQPSADRRHRAAAAPTSAQ